MPTHERLPIYLKQRYDPERLDAIARAATGKTRCPECHAVNPADQKYCDECGAALYPEWSAEAPAQRRGLIDLLIDDEQSSTAKAEEFEVEPEEQPKPSPEPHQPAVRIAECPRCHAPNPAENSYCGKCGSRLHSEGASGADPTSNTRDIDRPIYYK